MSTTVDLGKITASVTVGTTTTGAAGTNASVSNSGTTQDAVLNFTIPRGAQGVQGPQGSTGPAGPAGPTGPQGPMGDVAVITPEQQAAFTMYSVPGQNTDGPMTQKAVTDALVAGSISYDNSQSGLAADDVQGALDEVIGNIDDIFQDNIESDFDISDEQGYAIVRFINGEIRTKYFDSSAVPTLDTSVSDFAISDINGWDIVQFSGGHIKTKYFDSQLFVNTTKKFIGKKFAILGDSISTFQGWLPSDIAGYDGSTYATYYSSGDVNSVTKTWWYQMLEILGISPSFDVVNNCSWSGSQVTGDADSTTNAYAGCSDRRISDLSIRGYVPDIVIVFISCNDWHRSIPVGNWDIDTALPTVGNTLRSAYAIMLNKINLSYPNARIFCCTNLDDVARDKTAGYPPDTNGVTTYSWNKNIIEIAEAFGCDVINMHDCGIKYSNVASLAVDTGLHPNAAGMKMMAQKVASELIAKY
jgi:hypothetical protein